MMHSTLKAAAATVALAAALAPAALSRPADGPPSGPSGVQITPLAHGTISGRVNANRAGIRIRTRGPRDMLVTSISVDPGGTFGWHTHPGPVLVAVSAGTLTVYEPSHGRCVRSTVTAGDAFIENGGDIHLARNEETTPVQLNAIFLAPTGTSEFLMPAPEPAGCNV
jgi:quercetin dioxygenase-like cupin family protein